jgi:hypothetical protein
LVEELEGPHSISGRGMNDFATTAVLAAVKLAGNHEAVMIDLDIRLRDGHQQPPVVRMDIHGRLAKSIDFVRAVQLLEA